MGDAYSIVRKCYRNQIFVVLITIFKRTGGPFDLTGYNVQMLIGQPHPPINPDTIPLPGAPSWANYPGGYGSYRRNDRSVYNASLAEPATFPMPPWFSAEFGTVVFESTSGTAGFILGQARCALTSVQTEKLIALTPFNWMILCHPPGMDPSPVCGGPLLVMDAPPFI